MPTMNDEIYRYLTHGEMPPNFTLPSLSTNGDISHSTNQCKVMLFWQGKENLIAGRQYQILTQNGPVKITFTKILNKHLKDSSKLFAAEYLAETETGDLEILFEDNILVPENQVLCFPILSKKTDLELGRAVILHSLRRSENIHWQNLTVNKEERSKSLRQKPVLLWLTGLSGSGKSTIADALEKKLALMGKHTMLLDGDNIRHGLCKDLGFTEADRVENIRRIGEVSKLMVDAGLIVIASFISPYRVDRNLVRALFNVGEFIEIFVDTPIAVCEQRDPKGLYKKAREGKIPNFTGINAPYERPDFPEITINTDNLTIEGSCSCILKWLNL